MMDVRLSRQVNVISGPPVSARTHARTCQSAPIKQIWLRGNDIFIKYVL